jgi:hypothetical protein
MKAAVTGTYVHCLLFNPRQNLGPRMIAILVPCFSVEKSLLLIELISFPCHHSHISPSSSLRCEERCLVHISGIAPDVKTLISQERISIITSWFCPAPPPHPHQARGTQCAEVASRPNTTQTPSILDSCSCEGLQQCPHRNSPCQARQSCRMACLCQQSIWEST